MKIALLTEKYTPDIGGLAISTERLARLLTSAGHDVRVFCPSPNLPPSEKSTLPSASIRVTRFGAHKRVDDTLVDWVELIVEEHKRDPFDLLQGYFLPQAGFVAAYAGKYLNIPSVVSIRGNDIERAAFDPGKFSHVMYALQTANAVTTNASELIKKAKAFIDRKIFLIPNGIDTEHFKRLDVESSGLPPSFREHALGPGASSGLQNPIIGFVGELREKKGLKTLLSAYAQVNNKLLTSLLIVGEIRQGEDKQLFDEFRISNPQYRIIITGYIPLADLPAYYSLMDVFVHPSLRDGMPNAVLEAMACERAVVATPVGGMLDVINDGKNGIFVPANDSDHLAEKILELLADSSLRSRLGKNARVTITKKFTLERELDANLGVYREIGLQP
jgi:glycosyltransferase involved in cell wall biosynthesis